MTPPLQPVSVRIIADDLTGACDAAVAFACVGMTTEVEPAWGVRASSNAQAVAYNTESRDIAAQASRARMSEAAGLLGNAHHIFKKIDSMFRGNTLVEIARCLTAIPHSVAILAPAYPELGRTLKDGHLHCDDLAGKATLAIDQQLQQSGVTVAKIAGGESVDKRMLDARQAGASVLLCDSQTQQDLDEIVRATLAMHFPGRILWIGSGGLAHAVAAALSPAPSAACGSVRGSRILFLVGSDHPVTRKQVAHLKHAQPGCIVLPIARDIPAAVLRHAIKPYLSGGTSCIFATGGDTASAVCRAMEIARLELQCELDRGLPLCRIVGGPLDGAHFILKSGGFGDESILCRIAQAAQTQ